MEPNEVSLPIEPIVEEQAEFTPMNPAELEAALIEIRSRSFSGRHPELGKMINCPICDLRHRANEKKCEQKFTSTVKDKDGRLYEQFREAEDGTLVPDLRTAIREGEKPTVRQQNGAASSPKRYHPHPSKMKLQFIERTRKVFADFKFALEPEDGQQTPEFQEQFRTNLQRARVEAARQLRKERRAERKVTNRRRDLPGRILRGLEKRGSR